VVSEILVNDGFSKKHASLWLSKTFWLIYSSSSSFQKLGSMYLLFSNVQANFSEPKKKGLLALK
jgi:hypothetical protein